MYDDNDNQFEPGEDTSLQCSDCGRDFLWTSDEQAFYFERGLAAPKRCDACRANRKTRYAKRPRQ
jgi:hypothetical protein